MKGLVAIGISSVVTLTQIGLAQAERYLIVFEKDIQMNKVQNLFHNKTRGQGYHTLNEEAWSNFQVESALDQVNSLVVEFASSQLINEISKLPGVVAIEEEVFTPAPRPFNGYRLTQPWDFHLAYIQQPFSMVKRGGLGPKTPYGVELVNAPLAWEKSHYGLGSRVLVLDTGIDKNHPALIGNYEKGRNFVNDNNSPYEEADGVGHGTHVAGTIAASFGIDGFVGVAPEAKILAGRVCSEGCSNIAVAQGINWGIQERVDVISMSLGGPFATRGEKLAIEAAERAGIIVVAASGNDGRKRVSFPAAFPTVIAVGAVDSKPAKADFSNWGPELDVVAPGVGVISAVPMGTGKDSRVTMIVNGEFKDIPSTGFVGSPDVTQALINEVVYVGLGKPEDYINASVSGKFALIQRGEINFSDKAKNAIAAGARGAVIFNNTEGLIQGALTQDGSMLSIPVVMIEQKTGEELRDLALQGMSPQVEMQTVRTDYASFDGTSMATPHVAGVLALMRAANRSVSPKTVREIISETSVPLAVDNSENQIGKGLIDAQAAVEEAIKR